MSKKTVLYIFLILMLSSNTIVILIILSPISRIDHNEFEDLPLVIERAPMSIQMFIFLWVIGLLTIIGVIASVYVATNRKPTLEVRI